MIAAGARRSSRKAAATAAAAALEKSRSKSRVRPFFSPTMMVEDVAVGRWIASSSPLFDERERTTTTTTTSGRALFGTSTSVSSSSSSPSSNDDENNNNKNKSGSKTSDGSGAGDDGRKKGEEEAASAAAASAATSAAASTSKKAQDLLNSFRKQREKLRSDPRVKEAFSEAQKFKEEMKREVGMEKMFGKSEKEDAATSTSGKDASSASDESSSSGASSSSASTSTLKTSFIGRYFNVALEAIREEVRLLNMDEAEQFKEKRRKQREKEMRDYAAAAVRDGDAPASSAVQIVKPKDPTRFERMFEDVKQKLGFSEENLDRLQQSEAVKKLKNVQEDLRERWETSDSPMVHRIQDASESFFGETDQAEAIKLIRQMDVGFNTSDFLSEVKSTVPDVIKSYLLGDVEALKKMENISPEIIERMDGQINAWKSLGHVVDARLLHVSELELVEIRVLDNAPTVVLQFACQQVNCVRDAKTKEIIEGANDDIQSVHYLWAMQLSDVEFETEDGRKFSKPTWQLREMVLRGMMSIT